MSQFASLLIEALTSYYAQHSPMDDTIAHFIQQMQQAMSQMQGEDDPHLRSALGSLAEAGSEVDDPRVQALVGQAKRFLPHDPIALQELLKKRGYPPC